MFDSDLLLGAVIMAVIIVLIVKYGRRQKTSASSSLFTKKPEGGTFIHIDGLSGKSQKDIDAINRARSIFHSGVAPTSEASRAFDSCLYDLSDPHVKELLEKFSSEVFMRELRKKTTFDEKENKELLKVRNVEFATATLTADIPLKKFADNPEQSLSRPIGTDCIKDFKKIGEGTFSMRPLYFDVDMKTSNITLGPGTDAIAYAPFEQNGILLAKDDGTAIIVNFYFDGYFGWFERLKEWIFYDNRVQALYVLDAIFFNGK